MFLKVLYSNSILIIIVILSMRITSRVKFNFIFFHESPFLLISSTLLLCTTSETSHQPPASGFILSPWVDFWVSAKPLNTHADFCGYKDSKRVQHFHQMLSR